jgi:Ca-activated chloride channel family protein
LIIAIDVSASMQAADVQPTRLGKAVAVAEGLIEALERERVGLVLFAGEAYPLAPPTGDHEALRYLLGGVTPTIASAHDPGTLLSVGMRASVALLAADTESEGDRAIIVIGDGEAGELDDAVAAVAAETASGGVAIHAIGVGTAAGAGMVMPQAPYQLGGRIVDATGAPVISHLREPTLARLAAAGGGPYVHTDDDRGLQALFGRFEAPEPQPLPLQLDSFWTRYEPAHWLTAAALLLLLLESLADVRAPGRRPVARIARRTA